jgi:hypothetical protein
LGRKGHESKRGLGEIDSTPRTTPLYIKITLFDSQLIETAMKLEGKSKAQVVIESLRNQLSKYAVYTTNEGSDTP